MARLSRDMPEARADGETPLIFMVAGEPSGDLLGARLMAALRRRMEGRVRFAGIGGEAMRTEGLESLFPIAELSVMGLVEVLPRAPRILRRLGETAAAILRLGPDAVVTIDSPGFSYRVMRRVSGRGIPLIHYVAPSVWAWRPGRARKFARVLDHVMTLLPFEPPYFERAGLAASFVGHPALEAADRTGDGRRFRVAHAIAGDATVICVMPGSRLGEIRRHAEPFGEALGILAQTVPNLVAVVPTLPSVAEAVAAHCEGWPCRAVLITDRGQLADAFAASDVGLIASGTAALEAALADVPMVVAYRVSPATAYLLRRMLLVRHVSPVNIVLDREVVPELLQAACAARPIADALSRLIADPAARARQIASFAELVGRLTPASGKPSDAAAEIVSSIVAQRRGRAA